MRIFISTGKAFHADRSSHQLPNLSALDHCDSDDGCLELGCTLGFSALACPAWAAIRSSSVSFRSHETGMGRVASIFQLSCDRANDRSSHHRLARPVRLREVSSRRASAGKPGESRSIAPQSSPSRTGRRECERRERSDGSRGVAHQSEDAVAVHRKREQIVMLLYYNDHDGFPDVSVTQLRSTDAARVDPRGMHVNGERIRRKGEKNNA